MKLLIFRLVIPLTIISFAIFTKWWYVLVFDGPDEILTGFPLPYVCRGWHTSMSLQIFIAELIADVLTYFLFWLIMIYCINRFLTRIRLYKSVTIILWSLSILMTAAFGLIASNPDNLSYLTRDFDMEVMETGYKFVWQDQERPDYYKYHPERKK